MRNDLLIYSEEKMRLFAASKDGVLGVDESTGVLYFRTWLFNYYLGIYIPARMVTYLSRDALGFYKVWISLDYFYIYGPDGRYTRGVRHVALNDRDVDSVYFAYESNYKFRPFYGAKGLMK